MARLVKAWPPVVSALLLLGAFPPFELGLLVFVALVPWLVSLRETTGKGAFKSGYLFGFLYIVGQMHFVGLLVARWTESLGLAAFILLLCGVIGALYFALTAVLVRQCWKLQAPWVIPFVWAGIEVVRSYMPGLAFPYGFIAHPLWLLPPLIQNAYYGSVYLVSAWVVLVNVVIAMLVAGDGYAKAKTYALVCVVLLMASFVRFASPEQGDKKAIMVGQPGIDLAFGDPSANELMLRPIVRDFYSAARVSGASLLVLPEGVSGVGGVPPHPPFDVEPYPPVIFGGKRSVGSPTYQTAFAYDGQWHYADKTRLVVFGEYVPGRNWIPFLSVFRLPTGDLTAADRLQALDVGGMRLGPVLCFEGIFPDIPYRQALNGAQLLTVMSVDDWYFGSGAPQQLRAAAVWRAVETGLPLVRSATEGYSMAVNARGVVLAEAPLRQPRAFRVEVTLPRDPKPFLLWPAFPVVALLSLAGVPAWAWLQRRAGRTKG